MKFALLFPKPFIWKASFFYFIFSKHASPKSQLHKPYLHLEENTATVNAKNNIELSISAESS